MAIISNSDDRDRLLEFIKSSGAHGYSVYGEHAGDPYYYVYEGSGLHFGPYEQRGKFIRPQVVRPLLPTPKSLFEMELSEAEDDFMREMAMIQEDYQQRLADLRAHHLERIMKIRKDAE